MRRDRKGLRQCEREQKKTQTFFTAKAFECSIQSRFWPRGKWGGVECRSEKKLRAKRRFFCRRGGEKKAKSGKKLFKIQEIVESLQNVITKSTFSGISLKVHSGL